MKSGIFAVLITAGLLYSQPVVYEGARLSRRRWDRAHRERSFRGPERTHQCDRAKGR